MTDHTPIPYKATFYGIACSCGHRTGPHMSRREAAEAHDAHTAQHAIVAPLVPLAGLVGAA